MLVSLAMPEACQANRVGGKASNLARFYQHGVPIPPAIIVTAEEWQVYFQQPKLQSIVSQLLASEPTKRQLHYDKLCQSVIKTPLNPHVVAQGSQLAQTLGAVVAYRSSAINEDSQTTAYAGLLKSYLGQSSQAKTFERAIKGVWLSLFQPTTLAYMEHMHSDWQHRIQQGCAVIIQQIVPALTSGVCFQEPNQLRIEGIYGLGLPLVGGYLQPDILTIDADERWQMYVEPHKRAGLFVSQPEWQNLNPGDPIVQDFGKRNLYGYLAQYRANLSLIRLGYPDEQTAILSDDQYQMLVTELRKVALCSPYNKLDIEWAWAKHQAWILQVRPITQTISSMQGKPTQLGNVQGLAEGILWSPTSQTKPTKPYILYLPTIGPQHLPFLLEAEGVVVQQGGLLSHGAILCRELGKPLIIQPDQYVYSWLGRNVKIDGAMNLIDVSVNERGNNHDSATSFLSTP